MHDCRKCANWDSCPCGKTGHEKGTSIGFSTGECKDYNNRINLKGCINMPDREKVLTWLEICGKNRDCSASCPYAGELCREYLMADALELLEEQEVRELSINEWEEWKANLKRNPICELWENDTSPIWILNPDKVHEPALLMGKLKLFTGKPTFEQCKAVKWDD